MAEAPSAAGSLPAEASASPPLPSTPLAVQVYRRIVAAVLAAAFTFTFISSVAAAVLVFRTATALPLTLLLLAGWARQQTGALPPAPLHALAAFLRALAAGAALVGLALGAAASVLLGVATLCASARWRARVRDRIERVGRVPGARPLAVTLALNIAVTAVQLALGTAVLQRWYGPGHVDAVSADPVRAVACAVSGLTLSDAALDRWVWSKYAAQAAGQGQPSPSGAPVATEVQASAVASEPKV